MKIEVGKKYRTRSGRVAEIEEIYPPNEDGDDPYSFPVRGKIGTEEESWTRTGSEYRHGEHDNDLVAELDSVGEGVVETGGCAPPVVVEPVEIKPVEHPEPEFAVGVKFSEAERPSGMAVRMVGDGVVGEMLHAADIDTEFNPDAGRKDNSEPQPCTLSVPIGNMTEIDLIRALETVAREFIVNQTAGVTRQEMRRAVDWLHAKYGTPDRGSP